MDCSTALVTAVVTVMSVQPTSAKRTLLQDSDSAACASSGKVSDAANTSEWATFMENSYVGMRSAEPGVTGLPLCKDDGRGSS